MSTAQLFDYPPHPYLKQVLVHCPKAGATYMQLWESRNKNNRVSIYKKQVKSEYLISQSKFKNDLLLLVREGLASIDESPLMLTIELVGWDDNYDQFGEEIEK